MTKPSSDETTGPAARQAGAVPPERARAELLLELLSDDSPRVLASVRSELLRLGGRGRRALEKAARRGDARLRGRARQLLLEEARRRAVRRLCRYAARGDHDLETAFFLLDAHGAPGRDLRGYRLTLDAHGEELRRRIGARPMGRSRALELVDYLAGEVGLDGSSQDHHHPDNVYLHRAIERRAGMPLTLCALYGFIARRAGLKTTFVPLPGHVLLAVVEGGERLLLDPFDGGARVSMGTCRRYLAAHGLPPCRRFFRPPSDTLLFQRQVINLMRTCQERGRRSEAADLRLVLKALGGRGGRPCGR